MSDKVKQLSVRVPPEIHRQAKVEAARTGKQIQEVLEGLVKAWLAGEVKINGKPTNK